MEGTESENNQSKVKEMKISRKNHFRMKNALKFVKDYIILSNKFLSITQFYMM